MNALLARIEDRLFSAPDTVCLERARLVTEAHRRHAGEPVPVRRALALRHVLAHMTLDVESNPVFAGCTSSAPRAWMLVPEFSCGVDAQVALETGMAGFLDGKVPEEIAAFWKDRAVGNTCGGSAGIGHMSLDYGRVVGEGLEGVLRRLDTFRDHGSEAQRMYRRAMRIGVEAVLAWAARWADAAEAAAARSDDAATQDCLRRVASACRRVPRHPARNLHEGLQAIALVHLAAVVEGQGTSLSVGLPDRALAAFADETRQSRDTATALVRAFLLKIAANSVQGRGSKTQAVTVGGARADGTDACNPVTMAFLDAFAKTPVADPHLFLRWHAGVDAAVWRRANEMLAAGRSMPLLVSDTAVVPGLMEAGIAPEDAWEFCIVGCNELGIPGRLVQSGFAAGLGFDDLEVLDATMRAEGACCGSTEALVAAYGRAVEDRAEGGLAARTKRVALLAEGAPFAFCSACCRGCAEAGDDLLRALPHAAPLGLFLRGTSNAINVLAAVQQLVFEQHAAELPELLRRTDAGDPAMVARMAAAPKWGDGDDAADAWAVRLNAVRTAALGRVAERHGLPPFAVCHVVRSLHHLDGRRIGATVDGRRAGEPVADSLGPAGGTSRNGPTALLASVLRINAARSFPGIANLNLTLAAGQASAATVEALGRTFFDGGGQELQVSVLDAACLRDAQRRPERHRDLVVRVAGLNARFVELAPLEQNELLRRAERAAVQAVANGG
jgi:formate C-acetyltransferase